MQYKPHVLIVDDDELIRIVVEKIVNNLGYKATLAKNGAEALEYANNEIFDLIISDLYMPVMNGNELIKNIRSLAEYKNIPFLFLSGSEERKTWVQNLSDGADDFITKPFDEKVLALKIKTNIKRHLLRKDILRSNRNYNLNDKKGIIVYCNSKNNSFDFPIKEVGTDVKEVFDENELFSALKNLNIWMLIIDNSAKWAFNVDKIKQVPTSDFPIISLVNHIDEIDEFMNKDVGFSILKSLPKKYFVHQLNSFIEREKEVKNKYLNAIKLASENSPINFDNRYNEEFSNYKISILHEPYKHIPGGDYYEVYTHSDEYKIIVMGDVMGKKWGAWFFVNAYIAYIRSSLNYLVTNLKLKDINASQIINHLNIQVSKDLKISEVFTTLSVIVIKKDSDICIATAGAIRPFFYKFKDKSISQSNITGPLLGVIENYEYHQLELELNANDKLLFFTDGYTETLNSKTNKMITDSAVMDIFLELAHQKTFTLDKFEEKIIKKYNIEEFDDDRTLLMISKEN